MAISAFLGPLDLSVLDRVTVDYVVPLVALGVVTVLGAGLFYRGIPQPRE